MLGRHDEVCSDSKYYTSVLLKLLAPKEISNIVFAHHGEAVSSDIELGQTSTTEAKPPIVHVASSSSIDPALGAGPIRNLKRRHSLTSVLDIRRNGNRTS